MFLLASYFYFTRIIYEFISPKWVPHFCPFTCVLDYDTFITFMMISSVLTLSQNLWLVSTYPYYFLVSMSHQSSHKGSCFSSAKIKALNHDFIHDGGLIWGSPWRIQAQCVLEVANTQRLLVCWTEGIISVFCLHQQMPIYQTLFFMPFLCDTYYTKPPTLLNSIDYMIVTDCRYSYVSFSDSWITNGIFSKEVLSMPSPCTLCNSHYKSM